jgi:hypothetical protein
MSSSGFSSSTITKFTHSASPDEGAESVLCMFDMFDIGGTGIVNLKKTQIVPCEGS